MRLNRPCVLQDAVAVDCWTNWAVRWNVLTVAPTRPTPGWALAVLQVPFEHVVQLGVWAEAKPPTINRTTNVSKLFMSSSV